jgi:hypothetical protein
MNMQSALVLSILQRWSAYEWTVQGFGFIRTKIDTVGRIHVWDSRLATDLVSTAHTHPWHLKSTIISGELINQRLKIGDEIKFLPYTMQKIKTGEGGGLIGEPESVMLSALVPEIYWTGCAYAQDANEIHRTIAQDGTVTLLEREQGPPLEEATVFWPAGSSWVSAEPREAISYEISRTIDYALKIWNA